MELYRERSSSQWIVVRMEIKWNIFLIEKALAYFCHIRVSTKEYFFYFHYDIANKHVVLITANLHGQVKKFLKYCHKWHLSYLLRPAAARFD